MKTLLLLFSLFFQDVTDELVQNLNDDNPTVRESATRQLIEREGDLNRYKALIWDTTDPETKWRLNKVVQVIEYNQKFRSLSTISPLITIEFSGDIKDLFTKFTELTGQKFDARAFGDNKVTVNCTNTPLFQVLDDVCKQTGYDWDVVYRNLKGDYIKNVYGDRNVWMPNTQYTTSVELTGLGMSSKTPNSVVPGFKLQVVQTSLAINHKFNETITQAAIQFRYAADPSLRFVVGPKLSYSRIVTNDGTELTNTSTEPVYALVQPPPTTKTISFKGKATYRFPMKIEKIILDVRAIKDVKPDGNGDKYMGFAEYPNIAAKMTSNTFTVIMSGTDNNVKERFLNLYAIKGADEHVIVEKTDPNDTNGYFSTYDDNFQFYMYNNGSSFTPGYIEFQYVTELRDTSFDFAIDDIPLY